jgi:dienelactone hydrolase
MHVRDIEYRAGGRRMVGYLAVDDSAASGPRPSVLISHQGNGLSAHTKDVARRLANRGYLAFALDYLGGGQPPPGNQAGKQLQVLIHDLDAVAHLAAAGLDVLLDQRQADASRLAAIGYCFGAVVSLELARTGAPIKAVVGFHPGFTDPRTQLSRCISGSVLMLCGSADPFATAAQRVAFEQEMTEAGVVDWRIEVYGQVGHSFTDPSFDGSDTPGVRYDARSDRRSWQSMLTLFDEVLPTAAPMLGRDR